jgi:hypothetical protein
VLIFLSAGSEVVPVEITDNGGTLPLIPGAAWRVGGTVDSDGDCDTDILFQHDDGHVGIWYLKQNSNTPFGNTQLEQDGLHIIDSNPGPDWNLVGAANFDNNVKMVEFSVLEVTTPACPDYQLYFQHVNGSVGVWDITDNDNGTTVGAQVIVGDNPGPSWLLLSVEGDFNCDGVNDLLFQHSGGQVGVWIMESDGKTVDDYVNITNGNPGPTWDALGVGDYDSDGKVDDIRFQNTDGRVAVWLTDTDETSPGEYSIDIEHATFIDGNPGTAWHLIRDADLQNAFLI